MADFIEETLSTALKDNLSSDIVDYIHSIDIKADLEEFMGQLLDLNIPENQRIYEKIQKYKFGSNVQKKKVDKRVVEPSKQQQSLNNSKTNANVKANNKGATKKKVLNLQQFLSTKEKPGLKKGRHPCICQARMHNLVNNCKYCGRIVCEQEGSGPCFFCDNLVVSKDENEILEANDKHADTLYNHLMDKKKSKEWKKAIEHRNRLIEKDTINESVTKIIDDELDYAKIDFTWTDPKEKERLLQAQKDLLEKRYESRLKKTFTLNLETKSIEMADSLSLSAAKLEELQKLSQPNFPKDLTAENDQKKIDVEKVLAEISRSGDDNKSKKTSKTQSVSICKVPNYKVLDNDFHLIKDYGVCMSMHQPWATLLVAGIKQHEGRTWYTPHRGRLWIAAGSKLPEDEDIESCKEMYRLLNPDKSIKFPEAYPTSCLVGCVTVDDCLTQDQYREEYPNGESNSPYVFICSNPILLPVFFPMQGQHKIFPLPSALHRLVKEALITLKKL